MGFSEDDRIRGKNAVANRATELYDSYRSQKWSHNDIYAVAEKAVLKDYNDKVMYEVLKMALQQIVLANGGSFKSS